MEILEEKVSRLEEMMMRLVYIQQKTEMELQSLAKEMKEYKQEVDKQIREYKQEVNKQIKEMNKKWGELSNKMGTIVEDIISPATRPVLEKYFKCNIEKKLVNVEVNEENIHTEFDVIAVSNSCKTAFLIEVKTTFRGKFIEDVFEKIEKFKKAFPEYKDYKIVPILASLSMDENTVNILTKNKIYAMAYREWEYLDILNFNQL
ncbi:conserved hypothetical protein [Sulfurihydrogenibium azorense Az-Fu1]|uniref:DUF8196 domain-containing protein n=1 Tax=Sulfurihydrogenibium azorense (strain DSM 15241 / OCM 825 / Az-Fu1) TaxID=204536 RepID=C1DTX7_SULAA|nr:hypothetical protein [Sulfurihydrogenibium azorense]ACN99809.1 conserved hypothetical protein [Sulfurihydrogenibium azorense Az-Fu1]